MLYDESLKAVEFPIVGPLRLKVRTNLVMYLRHAALTRPFGGGLSRAAGEAKHLRPASMLMAEPLSGAQRARR